MAAPAPRWVPAGRAAVRAGDCGGPAAIDNLRMSSDPAPSELLAAFLQAHAQGPAVPAALFARGQELHRRLADAPPAEPAWGRFLVAMGELAAEALGDGASASRFFLAALQGAEQHGDYQAAVTAGYNQGVLLERRGSAALALAAYRAAAGAGFRLGVVAGNTLRAAVAAVRLHFANHDAPGEAALAKQAWLGWLWLQRHDPAQLDAELEHALGLQLCALLLPEDDPGALAARWRAWPPVSIDTPAGAWQDSDPACLAQLFATAAAAADRHLADEGGEPGAPYRLLLAAARRSQQV